MPLNINRSSFMCRRRSWKKQKTHTKQAMWCDNHSVMSWLCCSYSRRCSHNPRVWLLMCSMPDFSMVNMLPSPGVNHIIICVIHCCRRCSACWHYWCVPVPLRIITAGNLVTRWDTLRNQTGGYDEGVCMSTTSTQCISYYIHRASTTQKVVSPKASIKIKRF